MRGRLSEKIFGIGLGRTGSLSLAKAAEILGYKPKHAPKNNQHIQEHAFLSDIRVAWKYPLFDYLFSKAKFVLTIRNIDDWLESNRRWGEGKGERGQMSVLEHRFWCYGTCHFDEELFRAAYYRHTASVLDHFRGREGKLLVMDICGGDGWEKLCPFLEKDIPAILFPHLHKTMPVGDG